MLGGETAGFNGLGFWIDLVSVKSTGIPIPERR